MRSVILLAISGLVYAQKPLYKTFLYDHFDAIRYGYDGEPMVPVASCQGGETSPGKVTKNMFVYEFPSQQWFPVFYPAKDPNGNPDFTARSRAVTIVYNDIMWIIGGTNNPEATKTQAEFNAANYDTVYQFDYQQLFIQFVYTVGDSRPKGWGFASAVLANRFYIFGGVSYGSPCLKGTNDLWEFDPDTSPPAWRLISTGVKPPARFGAVMAGFKNLGEWPYSLIVFGGAADNCGTYVQPDMWKLSFNDVSSFDQGPIDWVPYNYTSWSPTEPFGQAFTQVGVWDDAMYIYGGVYGNLMRKVLKNVWEFNATTKYWRPMFIATDALPYACGASALAVPNSLTQVTYGSLTNETAGLFWVSYGGYDDVSVTPYRVGAKMNVLFNLAPPPSGILSNFQLLWISVLGPIVGVFLLLLFIYFYRRSQDLSAAGRVRMAYKPLNDQQTPEQLLAGLKDGEVPEDPAAYFQMMQNNQQNGSAAGSSSAIPSTSASVYSPMPGMPGLQAGYTGTSMGYTNQSSGTGASASFGYVPGGTAYGAAGGTSYGTIQGTAYGGYGGYGAYGAYGNPAASSANGSTLIAEVGSVNDPLTRGTSTNASVTQTNANATIVEEIGSVNRGDYSGSTGLTVIEDVSGGYSNNRNNATIIEDAVVHNPSFFANNNATIIDTADYHGAVNNNATIIDDAVLQTNSSNNANFNATIIDNAEIYPATVQIKPTIIDDAQVYPAPTDNVDSYPPTVSVNENTTEIVPPTEQTETAIESSEAIKTAPETNDDTVEQTSTEIGQEAEEPIPSAMQIIQQEIAHATRPRAISNYQFVNDAEEHITSYDDGELTSTVNPELARGLTQIETASVGLPEQLTLSTDLAVEDAAIDAGDLVTDLWSGPVRVATIAVQAVSATVRDNLKGFEFGSVKFWTPNKSIPDEVTEVLARREIIILNFLRNTPNVIQFVGYSVSPLRIITRLFNATLFQELQDSSNFKWSQPDIKRAVINDLITGFLYIHGKGIIHNRLNPKAVLIQYTQERDGPIAVLGDFSNAMMVGSDSSALNTGVFVPMQYRYIAPEILADLKPSFSDMTTVCSQSSDVYSFGMVVYEIVTRTAPFYECSEEEARSRILNGESPVLPAEFMEVYAKYDELVRVSTSRDADQRPGDFLQIRQFFESI